MRLKQAHPIILNNSNGSIADLLRSCAFLPECHQFVSSSLLSLCQIEALHAKRRISINNSDLFSTFIGSLSTVSRSSPSLFLSFGFLFEPVARTAFS